VNCFGLIVATISIWFVVVVVGEDAAWGSAADERIGPLAVELVGVMPLTTAARGSRKICCWRDFAGTLPVRLSQKLDRRISVAPMHFLALLTGLARQP
jgi:hypothetical protein